jgi:NADH-quinone oxidoreductase subunit N
VTAPVLDFSVVGPISMVGIGALFVLVGEVLLSRVHTFMSRAMTPAFIGSILALSAMFWLAVAAIMSVQQVGSGEPLAFNAANPMLRVDGYSAAVTSVVALAALMSCALSMSYLDELRIHHGEYYALLLFSTAGMMLMVTAVDMLPLFLGLELTSIPAYVLAGFDRRRLSSNESALKYFLMGAFATALLLYGVALLYGVSGGTSFAAIRAGFDPANPIAVAGLGLVIAGFAFKVASVPFHQWTPDVYEGAPTTVSAFLAVTVKVAAFAALLRVLVLSFDPLGDLVEHILQALAVLSMVVGNVMAVIQTNVKRMLAYSSIGHTGYVLIGFAAGHADGYAAVVFYLLCYVFMNLGAFAIVVALAHRGRDCEEIEDFAGLARVRPGMAALMTLFMLSLAGIPLTAGFIGKVMLFSAAVVAGQVWLAVVGVAASVVSLYYYMRLPVLMYMHEPASRRPRLEIASGEIIVLSVCALGVLYLGINPNGTTVPMIDWARESVRLLFAGH